MTSVKHLSELAITLQERGFIHQCSDIHGLDQKAFKNIITAYSGFDATAESLHIGHLIPIMMLRWMQKLGHCPIVLIGGGTTKVGDPSGKDKTRQILDQNTIDNNIAAIKGTFEKFIEFDEAEKYGIFVNNSDWLDALSYIPFLRDIGSHFTINRMLTMDSVKLRLEREQPLTFLEFNYMILQSFDFVELNKRYGCNLQIGGSDQWGNIVNGIDLGRRINNSELYGLTSPLVMTSSGAKMGKTASGAVWLSEKKFSAYDYYQYWRNTEDPDVIKFLKLYTELPLTEIKKLSSLQGADINEAKKILAYEATKLLHGEKHAKDSDTTATLLFKDGLLSSNLKSHKISSTELSNGFSLIEVLKVVGFCKTNGESRRLIRDGGAKLNDVRISDENYRLESNDFSKDGEMKVSAGKKRHALIIIE